MSALTLPVTFLNPQTAGSRFQFQFRSQTGTTNTVQSRANLAVGGLGDANLPVLLTSGYFDRGAGGGVRDWPMLQKPYGFQDLAQKVSAALAAAPPRSSG